jgi:hypothetical protein
MSTIPPIQVKIEVDDKGVITGLTTVKQGIKGVDDSVKTASTGMSKFSDNLKKVAGALGATFAAAKVVDFAKESIMAASNMAESLSKVNVVFGESAQSVIDFSKTAADSMGMSSQEALEAAGTYGNLFQALGVTRDKATEMSTGLVSLAADLGSFNNMSTTDSLNALRSGLSGETEPLKRFGIALNDVTLKNKAMEMGFGKITGVMDPAIKAQVTYALVLEQTKLAQGDYARTADGTANTMKTLQAKMQDAKVAVGDALMPAFQALLGVLKVAIPVLEKIGNFFKNNQAEVKAFAITVGILGTAWAAYTVYVKAAIIQQKILNLVQKLNPIGLIVIAVGLLVAAMVKLWNSNESFRKAVVSMAKVALQAFASIIPMVANVFEVIMKVNSGPLRLLLMALSKLPGVGKYAKAGLDAINSGLNSISDFGVKAANKATELAAKLDKVAASAGKAAKKTKESVNGVTTGETTDKPTGGKITAEEQKRLDKLKDYAKDVQDIYKDMNEVIVEAEEKAAEALADRDEKMAVARQRAKEQEDDLRKSFREANAAADERYLEATAEAFERRRKANAEADKRYAEADKNIRAEYAKKVIDIEEAKTKKLADLRESAAKKSLDLTQKANEKQNSIIQQSMDRLRSAFASKTGFSLADSFKDGGSASKLLNDLKAKLQGAKDLQANAATLAGMGYSQTFIEEVVKNGPEAGNKIAQALKEASPEATKELQLLYGQVETISDTGLDELAKSMNKGGRLATQQLMDAYAEVAIDLKESLATVDAELQTSLAEANKAYLESMTEAKTNRDEKLAEAMNQLKEALAASQEAYDEAIADADKALKKAQKEAQKDLDEGLVEIQDSLRKALLDAQKDYEKAIDDINDATMKKLAKLKEKLKEVADLMAALGAANAAASAMQNAPTYAPIIPNGAGVSTSTTTAPTTNTTVNITGVNLTDPNSTSSQVINAIRFGNVVVPSAPSALASGESGAIGAASIKARSYTLPSAQSVSANLRDR